ncbi:hypothetical protein B0G62_102149 [Paraburkholderia eburnea]|uniref:Uncharacterized protein n=1 Tax=Paraburkholderia eburnea TaxID=1189126 RepID=A0A2S4MIP3_9BURK|nr:hypothetical protein B0G62_102149 [Paraburkholderia eburnea]PRZ19756.1 hypothetical protein BX588_114149 [Paraburkholderia eburnea]
MRGESAFGEIRSSAQPEKVFLQLDNVKVTSARFMVPGQTFAMSGITSVQHWRTPRKWLFGALLIFMGLPMLLTGVSISRAEGSAGPLTLGLILAGLGAYLLWRGRPQSQVRLQSASGEAKAFTSHDDALVRRIVAALSDAIVYRG